LPEAARAFISTQREQAPAEQIAKGGDAWYGWRWSRAEPAASAQNVTVNAIAPGYINTGMFEAVA
jgi:hypothetical protein